MKSYIKGVSIDALTYVSTDKTVECKKPKPESPYKRARLDFSLAEDGRLVLFIEHTINPDSTTSDLYEFEITSGNEEFPVVENDETVMYHYAEISKNRLTIYHICSIQLELRALDGSQQSDSVTIICREYDGKLD